MWIETLYLVRTHDNEGPREPEAAMYSSVPPHRIAPQDSWRRMHLAMPAPVAVAMAAAPLIDRFALGRRAFVGRAARRAEYLVPLFAESTAVADAIDEKKRGRYARVSAGHLDLAACAGHLAAVSLKTSEFELRITGRHVPATSQKRQQDWSSSTRCRACRRVLSQNLAGVERLCRL